MAVRHIIPWLACIAVLLPASAIKSSDAVGGIGVNWGTMASHPISPRVVVEMLKVNGIKKVKLFDADGGALRALAGTGIEVMVGIPNDQLEYMSTKLKHARRWVKENVTSFIGQVNIKYIAVGNEPLLTSYNGIFTGTVLPALKNIQQALTDTGLGHRIKATVPLNADVYSSPSHNPVPSAGNFRSEIQPLMTRILRHLHSHSSPFVVNIYPFLSLYQDPNFPLEYAFLDGLAKPLVDGRIRYSNVFDANYDTLVSSIKKAGVPDVKIIVGEVGWPTDGDRRATRSNAKRFYDGLLKKIERNEGTPLRPGRVGVYLFSLFDEDMKSILPGNFEKHWGLFFYDGKPKFKINFRGKDKYLVGARGVEYLDKQWCVFDEEAAKDSFRYIGDSVSYACTYGDCTPLGYGSSCNGVGVNGNISYAFNAYYQVMDQDVRACDFHGLARVTTSDPSRGGCKFPVEIVYDGGERARGSDAVVVLLLVVAMVVQLFSS